MSLCNYQTSSRLEPVVLHGPVSLAESLMQASKLPKVASEGLCPIGHSLLLTDVEGLKPTIYQSLASSRPQDVYS